MLLVACINKRGDRPLWRIYLYLRLFSRRERHFYLLLSLQLRVLRGKKGLEKWT